MGAIYKVKKGNKVSFWDDVWIGDTPLKIQFPDLYRFCDDPNVLVEDCYYEDETCPDSKRSGAKKCYA
jgi:hypothetical protein